MTSIKYDDIFNAFLGMVEDYNFFQVNQDDLAELLTELLHKSVYSSYMRHLFNKIVLDDIVQEMSYEMNLKIDEETDKQFLIVATAKWMKYEWLSPQLNSVVNTAQFFGGKEQTFYSQANHITELREMSNLAYKEARDFVRDRGFVHNTYLSNGGMSS